MRRRVTRRLTRLQTMSNGLKYRKILENVALRLRCGCVYFFNLLKTSTVQGNDCKLKHMSEQITQATFQRNIEGENQFRYVNFVTFAFSKQYNFLHSRVSMFVNAYVCMSFGH